jgi:hypothetical protein
VIVVRQFSNHIKICSKIFFYLQLSITFLSIIIFALIVINAFTSCYSGSFGFRNYNVICHCVA